MRKSMDKESVREREKEIERERRVEKDRETDRQIRRVRGKESK